VDENNQKIGAVTVMHDITERKGAEQKLRYDAFHDSLTGLANRNLFMNHVMTTIERSKRNRANTYGVLFLDIDRFKTINDSLGHATGDKLTKTGGSAPSNHLRTGDLLARFGGERVRICSRKLTEPGDALRVGRAHSGQPTCIHLA